jgi:hypothetical protein
MNKFHLQPYQGAASRFRCPACNHRTKSFSRYINSETNETVAPHVGRCNREDKCGYHLSPSQYFREAGLVHRPWSIVNSKRLKVKKRHGPSTMDNRQQQTEYYISPDYVNDSFCDYDKNNFVAYLINRFGLDVTDGLVGKYRIGTSNYWHGATIFWQLDTNGYVRTGKIMLYDKQTGKRVKQPFNHINWVHSVLVGNGQSSVSSNDANCQQATANFVLRQCLFGEHLLITSPYKPVAIVESEKTAIVCSVLMPGFIWLASGSLEGLSIEKCKVLQSRKVVLFPDVNAYHKWKMKAMELRRAMPGTTIVVSDELERLATDHDRKKGSDLGDVLQ